MNIRKTLNVYLLIFLILSGLILRMAVISIPGFAYDVGSWFAWSLRLDQVPFSDFYSDEVFSDYLPGYLYVLKLLGILKSNFNIENNTYFQILKLPSILAEIGIGILIYLILKQKEVKKAPFWASLFFILNPAIIFNSSVWGQVDGVLTLFLLLSIYFLTKRYFVLSSFIIAIAFLIKPQAVFLAPVFLLFLIRKFTLINFAKLTIPAFITTIILSFPFFPANPIIGLFQKLMQTAGEYPYTSLNAYNFWGTVGFFISDQITWNGLTYQLLGFILFAVYWLILAYFYIKGRLSLYSLAALAALAFFFLPTKVHERYLYPSFVFLIITSFQLKSKLLFSLTAILSLLHLLNLYFVYIYYNKFQLNSSSSIFIEPVYNFAANNAYFLSSVSTFLFLILSIIIINRNNEALG